MTDRETTIGRWVRLKQASKAADAVPGGAAATATPAEAEAPGDAPVDLASLPSIESIAADTDIAAFLRAGVPPELTRAALRRAWARDPAIRDFIGIAENQWDFNDPDAIPGFGPLTPTQEGADALAQIASRLREIAGSTSSGEPASTQEAHPPPHSAEVWLADPTDKDIPTDMPEAAPERDENAPIDDHHAPVKRRRHGGALPQ